MSGTGIRRYNIAIAGFGAVGRAVAEMLAQRRDRYRARYGLDVRLTAVRRSRAALVDLAGLDASRLETYQNQETPPRDDFLATAEADVLVEATPSEFRSGGAGLGYMRTALSQGRHVIAVSKGALVRDGLALRALAAEHGARLKVSAATGAALPAFDLLEHGLAGCAIGEVEGILNATSNHLLGAMMERGLSLTDALEQAQKAGIAEADPSVDIDGWDTASKILILANFALGAELTLDRIAVSGIQHVGAKDIEAWRDAGLVPKLVGTIRRGNGTTRAEVGLRTFPAGDPFAMMGGDTKAIRIATDVMGEIFAWNRGAEPRATAAAALKDLEHILERDR